MKKVGPNRPDENRIRRLAAEGASTAEISDLLQIKERAIVIYLNSLPGYDLPVPPETVSNDDRRVSYDKDGNVILGAQNNPGAGVVVDPANAPDQVIHVPVPSSESATQESSTEEGEDQTGDENESGESAGETGDDSFVQ